MLRKRVSAWFLPAETNDYSPHILEQASIAGMFVLIVLTFVIVNIQSLVWVTSEWMVGAVLPAVIVTGTNDERVEASVPALTRNSLLDEAASRKARHMADGEYFSHYSPSGLSPWYWFKEAGYQYEHAGENLAIHFTDSDEVIEAWMDSPTHRENILNHKYTEIGIGTAKGEYEGEQTIYVVQLFGSPVSPAEIPSSPEKKEVLDEKVQQAEQLTSPAETVLIESPQEIVEEENSIDQAPVVEEKALSLQPETESVLAETDSTEETIFNDTNEQIPPVLSSSLHTQTQPSSEPQVILSAEVTPIDSFWSLMTRPNTVLQYVYISIGTFVTMTLLLSIFVEIRRQRPLHILYSGGLITTMAILFYLHLTLTSGAIIV